MRQTKELNTMLTVLAILVVLALTACGKSSERFVGGSDASLEVLPSTEVVTVTETKEEVKAIVIEVAIERAEEVLAQVEEVAKVEVVEESSEVVTVVVDTISVEEVKQVEAVAVIIDHCKDGKGKDGAKNKHCK